MIKRAGVEIMNARTGNVSIAKETLNVLKQKQYRSKSGNIVDISNELDAAVQGTVYYPGPMPDKDYIPCKPTIEVVNETTAQAAARLIDKGKTDAVALNFASARSVGGGFLAGAVAQEEDLCRCSGLYACTKNKPLFYNANIMCSHSLYTDGIIYSPKVPFFRDEHCLFLEKPFLLSIISAPAPNNRSDQEHDDEEVYATLHYRASKILQVAKQHNHKTIILGAWGCGAFGNNPDIVANIFMDVLKDIPAFEYVCFAVYDNRDGLPLYTTFKQVVGV